MNETIEKRYERIKKIFGSESYYGHMDLACLSPEQMKEIESLLSDLMAERKSVDLDTLFPKEVMEKAWYFRAFNDRGAQLDGDTKPIVLISRLLYQHDPQVFSLRAYEFEDGLKDTEIARVRVRLGLRVERVE